LLNNCPYQEARGFAIVVVLSGTHELEAPLPNEETDYGIAYNTMGSAERRLQSLPAPIEFDPHLKTVQIPRPKGKSIVLSPFCRKGAHKRGKLSKLRELHKEPQKRRG